MVCYCLILLLLVFSSIVHPLWISQFCWKHTPSERVHIDMVSHTFATRLIPSSLNISPCLSHLVASGNIQRPAASSPAARPGLARDHLPRENSIGIARTIRSISGMRWPESCATPIGPSIMWMRLGIGGLGSARFCHADSWTMIFLNFIEEILRSWEVIKGTCVCIVYK